MATFRLLVNIWFVLLVTTKAEEEWWQTATIYQVYPRSFKDTNGDGIGDLKGITEGIPHLIEAGITCVWLSPIYPSPMVDFGYDVSNFTAIDPIFGTWEDFVELASAIRTAGLRLVMVIVPGHSSDQHEWFQKSLAREEPYTDYYVWQPSKGLDVNGSQIPPNNWLSAFSGTAWQWNEQRQEFYLHQFAVEQPDLNYRNPLVVQEMKNVLRFWLENGVDGFRLDAPVNLVEHADFLDEPPSNDPDCPPQQPCQLHHIYTMNQPETLELLYEFSTVVQQYEEETGEAKVIMSEPSNEVVHTMSYYGNSSRPIIDFPFNFNLIYDINNQSNAQDLAIAIFKWINLKPEGTTADWVIGNHDQFRVGTRQGSEFAVATNMMSLLLPGVSVTYYGEEINMENTFISWEDTQDPQGCNAGQDLYQRYSRDPQRTPFQWNDKTFAGFTTGNKTWLPVNDNYLTLNLEAQRAAERSPFKIFQALTSLRNAEDAIKRGSLNVMIASKEVLAFTRELEVAGQRAIAVLVNTAYSPQEINLRDADPSLPSQGTVHTASMDSVLQSGDIIDLSSIPLAPRGGIVITYTKASFNNYLL